VEATPGQPIKPRRNVRFGDLLVLHRKCGINTPCGKINCT
jgi:hypothetical protein